MTRLVFLGPTMRRREAEALLPAAFRPPARRGDIYRALRAGFTTIILIDGEFHGSPSVWQREILEALAEGARVHGASSMGALRAAELHGYGMIGHGRIFAWYRDGVIDADDEVALTYGPAELGYPALSEPLVNIRATLDAAPSDVIAAAERDALIAHAKALHFPDRSFAALTAGGPASAWPVARRTALARFLAERRIDLKCQDAVAALTSIDAARRATPLPCIAAPAVRLYRRERLVAEGFASDPRRFDAAALAQGAAMADDELEALRRDLSSVFFVAEWGRDRGITATGDDIARERARCAAATGLSEARIGAMLAERALAAAAMRAFAAENGITDAEAARRGIILAWASENGVGHAGLKGDALVDWVIENGPAEFGYWWSFEVELAEALQLAGRAGKLDAGEGL
jgi:hypothetical protein